MGKKLEIKQAQTGFMKVDVPKEKAPLHFPLSPMVLLLSSLLTNCPSFLGSIITDEIYLDRKKD